MGFTLLKVSDVAAKVGVLPSTIRYYQKLGLLEAIGTTRGGFNLFDEAAAARAAEVRRLQREERLTLEAIRQRLNGVA